MPSCPARGEGSSVPRRGWGPTPRAQSRGSWWLEAGGLHGSVPERLEPHGRPAGPCTSASAGTAPSDYPGTGAVASDGALGLAGAVSVRALLPAHSQQPDRVPQTTDRAGPAEPRRTRPHPPSCETGGEGPKSLVSPGPFPVPPAQPLPEPPAASSSSRRRVSHPVLVTQRRLLQECERCCSRALRPAPLRGSWARPGPGFTAARPAWRTVQSWHRGWAGSAGGPAARGLRAGAPCTPRTACGSHGVGLPGAQTAVPRLRPLLCPSLCSWGPGTPTTDPARVWSIGSAGSRGCRLQPGWG